MQLCHCSADWRILVVDDEPMNLEIVQIIQ
jgi:hypothetical protein